MSDEFMNRENNGIGNDTPVYNYDSRENTETCDVQITSESELVNDAPVTDSGIYANDARCSREWYGNGNGAPNTEVYTSPYKKPEEKRERQSGSKRRMPTAIILVLCILLSTIFGGGSALAVNIFMNIKSNGSQGSSGMTINQVSGNYEYGSSSSEGLSTADVVARIENSVVEITTEYVKTGVFSQQYITSGGGSGVIIDKSGYIVTNNHVIEDAKSIKITLHSGESYEAVIIGSDEKEDVALLKVDATLEPVVFGNSDKLRVGDKTIAVGNPLGQLGGTVTEGIISALDRELSVDGQKMTLLQTDSAINPGNSGGGLFDANGDLIGVVCAKSSGSEIEGLGFAIPVNTVIDVISDLMEYGYVRGRVNLGMEFIDIDSTAVAWMYGLSDLGCYVYSVGSGSNAEKAGIKSGDRVVSLNDTEIKASSDIEELTDTFAVGDTVKLGIVRSGRLMSVELVLEEYVPTNFSTDNSGNFVQWNEYGGN